MKGYSVFLKSGLLFVASVSIAHSSLALADGPFIGVDIGTRGPNLDVGYSFGKSFSIRAQGTDFTYSYTTTRDDTNYAGNLNLSSASILGDWYPGAGNFRITSGLVYNNDNFHGTVKSQDGLVTINGATFPVTPQDHINVSANWQHQFMPYFGIGFGNPATHKNQLSVTTDIGVIVTDHPKARLTAEGPNSYNPTFQYDLQQEQISLNNDLRKLSVWPVISVQLYVGL